MTASADPLDKSVRLVVFIRKETRVDLARCCSRRSASCRSADSEASWFWNWVVECTKVYDILITVTRISFCIFRCIVISSVAIF